MQAKKKAAQAYTTGAMQRVDATGKTVLPGFVESHTHPFHLGHNLENLDCRGMRDIGQIIDALGERAAQTPKGQWLTAHTYDDTLLADKRHLTRADLDRASTDHPIFVTHVSGHSGYANSAALAIANIDSGTADPADGRIDRDDRGEPTGILWEWSQRLVTDRLPPKSVEDITRQVCLAADEYLRAGVTSAVEAVLGHSGNGLLEATALAALAETGECPIRLGAAIAYPTWKKLKEGAAPGLRWSGDPDRARALGVKLFQDGSIQLRTGALSCPYHGHTEPADTRHLIWSQEQLERVVEEIHNAGWQIFTHANGDHAIDSILDAYERVLPPGQGARFRHRIEHCQTAREDQLDRMARLGVPASVFAAHVYYWGDRHRDIFLGPERAARISPMASIIRRGIHAGLHNDTPVTPISPLLSIGTAVSRRTSSGKVLGPDQAISVDQALKAMTIESAWLAFEEERKGSLKAGKLGDVVVLDADPHEVDPAEIKDIPVAMTIVGGKVAYAAR